MQAEQQRTREDAKDVANTKKFLKVISIIRLVAYALFAAPGIAIMVGVVPLETITEGLGV